MNIRMKLRIAAPSLIPFRFVDGIMGCMPKILYSQVIEEDPRELQELEKRHRYTHLFQRVRMLRLLKSEECRKLGEAAEALGYSWRQCQRWFASYRKGERARSPGVGHSPSLRGFGGGHEAGRDRNDL